MFQLEAKPQYNSHTLVSVVIPVYNQERAISTSLARIGQVLNSLSRSYELIVVNDGSRDDTLKILQREQASNPRLKVVSYDRNMGKGYAVRRGILESKGDLVMFTDGDLDISPHIISEYIQQLQSYDLVVGSKRHPLSRVNAPTSRRFLSRAFNLVVRILTGIQIRDTQAGLKAGNGPALRTIFKLMLVKRYAFDVELLTIASLLKMQTKEMPIEINLDRKFKLKDIARMFVDVLGISYRYRIRRWYQKQLQNEVAIVNG
jgi:dolichol-phosphate mannosyltransferase